MKKCPYCAEDIQNEAIKCKHCEAIVSEKDQRSHVTGFWEDLGQRAKKNLDKFESNVENRKKQRQAGVHALRQSATKELDKFKANTENREKRWKKIFKPPSFWDYLLGFLILIIIVFCYLVFKPGVYLLGSKILEALGF